MCYDIKASLEAQLQRALRRGDQDAAAQIREELLPYTDLPLFHASGFSHPRVLVYTDDGPDFPTVATWGLVPHWVRDAEQQKKLWNQTLNARGETIFDKPSFRQAARSNRCLLYVDGFYEHHHKGGHTYPYFIRRRDGQPMALAGLYSDWKNPAGGEPLTTFSIVTTEGNSLLARIHNNPKLAGPRMPLILPDEMADQWLQPLRDDRDRGELEGLIRPYPEQELEAYTVTRLRGREYPGNVPEVSDPVAYPELQE